MEAGHALYRSPRTLLAMCVQSGANRGHCRPTTKSMKFSLLPLGKGKIKSQRKGRRVASIARLADVCLSASSCRRDQSY